MKALFDWLKRGYCTNKADQQKQNTELHIFDKLSVWQKSIA